jgi:hypothetical protein
MDIVLKHEVRQSVLEIGAQENIKLFMKKPKSVCVKVDSSLQDLLDSLLVQELNLELSACTSSTIEEELSHSLLQTLLLDFVQ